MNPNWLGIVSAILAIIAFLVTYRLTKDTPVKKRAILATLAVLTAIPGASFSIYYAHIFPEQDWYYQFRSLTGTEFLIVFLGIAGGLAATFLPHILLILPLLGVVAFSITPFIKPFIGPIPDDTFQDEWHGEVCLQSTPSTCGAASTATILKRGTDVKESEIAAEAHSYAGGTEAWYLARAVRARGFDVEFVFTEGFSPEIGLPAVVGVQLGAIGHFIPILGQEGERFIIGDPLHGRELLSLDQLNQRYKFTGFHMRIKAQGE